MPEHLPPNISDSTLAFIKCLTAVYGAPDTGDAAEFKRILNDKIGHHSTDLLLEVADEFITTRKSWPKMADIISGAISASIRQANAQRVAMPSVKQRDPWSDEAAQQANELIQCDMGVRADREGWLGHLWDYCRDKGRLPGSKSEIAKLVSAAKRHAKNRRFARSGKAGLAGAAVKRFALAFDEDDVKLSNLVREWAKP